MDIKNFVLTNQGHIRLFNRQFSLCSQNVSGESVRVLTPEDLKAETTCKTCVRAFLYMDRIGVKE